LKSLKVLPKVRGERKGDSWLHADDKKVMGISWHQEILLLYKFKAAVFYSLVLCT